MAFDLSKDYDMDKITDRFLKSFNSFNPCNYLYTDTQIRAKKKIMEQYNERKASADSLG